jgi:hypothetical protein
LYFESTNVAEDYQGTAFFNYMGISYLGEGTENEVAKVSGVNQTITSDLKMNYQGGTSPHYGVDRLGAVSAEQLFTCEHDYGRFFLLDNGNNKIVTSSLVIGALANNDSLNLKPFIFSEIVNRFINYDPSVSVEESSRNSVSQGNFPDPFSSQTTITFKVSDKSQVSVDVFNNSGLMVKNLLNQEMTSGEYSISWDGTSSSGYPVQSGVYFYQIRVNNKVFSDKMLLVK